MIRVCLYVRKHKTWWHRDASLGMILFFKFWTRRGFIGYMHELRATYFLHSATHRVQDWHRVQYWHRFQDNALTRVDWYKENKCFALSTRDRPFNLKRGGACFFSILVRLNSATIFLWRVVRYNIFSPNYMYHYFISYKISIRISVSSKYIIKKKHTHKKNKKKHLQFQVKYM